MAHRPGREARADPLTTDALSSPLIDLARQLQALALARGHTVGTAESCTGGLVAHAITSVPGSSGYYPGGVVSYADRVKSDLLGVPAATLEHHGAVSAQTAVAMADGLRARLGCSLAVAVTGVAGPDGGSESKPVGLTYVAVASDRGHEVRRHVWEGDRATNQERSAAAALRLLIEVLESGEA